jgi:hypothetical protein
MTRIRTTSALPPLIALCFFLASSAPAQTSQSVHVVNGSGDVLQAAIDAAAEGDTLLIRGHYGPIHIDRKALTLVAENGWWVSVHSLVISNTTAEQTVTVSGLTTDTPVSGGAQIVSLPPSILIDNCKGGVRLSDMNCHAYSPNTFPVLTVNESPNVVLMGMDLFGRGSPTTPTLAWFADPGCEAVRATHSRIAMYSCILHGGAGTNGSTQDPCETAQTLINQRPGAGISLDADSSLFAWRTTFAGGNAGAGVPARCDCVTGGLIPGTDGLDGAPAIQNEKEASVTLSGCSLFGGVAGLGGAPATCSGTPAGAGVPGSNGPATTNVVQTLDLPEIQSFSSPRVVRAGQPISLGVQGHTGTTVQLGASGETQFVPVYGAQGVLMIGPSGRRATMGTVPSGSFGFGNLYLDIPSQLTTPGAQAEIWHFQTFVYTVNGIQVGPVRDVIVLDPSF